MSSAVTSVIVMGTEVLWLGTADKVGRVDAESGGGRLRGGDPGVRRRREVRSVSWRPT
jgi:hypothetical protein